MFPSCIVDNSTDDDNDEKDDDDLDLHVPESGESLKLLRQPGQLIVLQEQVAQLSSFFLIFSFQEFWTFLLAPSGDLYVPVCAIRDPAVGHALIFSLSPMLQCENSCSKLLQHHQSNPKKMHATNKQMQQLSYDRAHPRPQTFLFKFGRFVFKSFLCKNYLCVVGEGVSLQLVDVIV